MHAGYLALWVDVYFCLALGLIIGAFVQDSMREFLSVGETMFVLVAAIGIFFLVNARFFPLGPKVGLNRSPAPISPRKAPIQTKNGLETLRRLPPRTFRRLRPCHSEHHLDGIDSRASRCMVSSSWRSRLPLPSISSSVNVSASGHSLSMIMSPSAVRFTG